MFEINIDIGKIPTNNHSGMSVGLTEIGIVRYRSGAMTIGRTMCESIEKAAGRPGSKLVLLIARCERPSNTVAIIIGDSIPNQTTRISIRSHITYADNCKPWKY